MSGHSKWATTHRQKELVDAKRGKIFTKLGNVITIAARKSGDPASNPALRAAIDRARDASMPKDNIERAIKKGTGELAGEQLEELNYEAIGPNNSQFVIKCVTSNKNRTSSSVRHIFSKYGGAFGSVLWNFELKGVIMINSEELKEKKYDLDDLELELIDAGADNIERAEEGITVYSKLEDLQIVKTFLEGKNIKIESANVEYVAKDKQDVSDDSRESVDKLLDELEDDEDVSDYYTNLNL